MSGEAGLKYQPLALAPIPFLSKPKVSVFFALLSYYHIILFTIYFYVDHTADVWLGPLSTLSTLINWIHR